MIAEWKISTVAFFDVILAQWDCQSTVSVTGKTPTVPPSMTLAPLTGRRRISPVALLYWYISTQM